MSTHEPPFGSTALRMFSGVIIWAVHFFAIYSFTALACTRGFAAAVPWTIVIGSVIAIGTVLLIMRGSRRRESFADWMTISVGAVAILAMTFETLALVWIPVCGMR